MSTEAGRGPRSAPELLARFLLAVTIGSVAASTAVAVEEPMQMGQETLLATLQDEAIWIDPDRRPSLLEALDSAGRHGSEVLAALLVERIDYSPYEEDVQGIMTPERRFPVVGALVRMGRPAVPSILRVLKTADPDDLAGGGQQRHNLAVHCLLVIYQQHGGGARAARAAVEEALKGASGSEGVHLRRALGHPRLADG